MQAISFSTRGILAVLKRVFSLFRCRRFVFACYSSPAADYYFIVVYKLQTTT
jgi:hypothetical protein